MLIIVQANGGGVDDGSIIEESYKQIIIDGKHYTDIPDFIDDNILKKLDFWGDTLTVYLTSLIPIDYSIKYEIVISPSEVQIHYDYDKLIVVSDNDFIYL
jgi:hypothetical protein